MQNKTDLQEFSMHVSRREMKAYLDGKLTAEDSTRMDTHLKFCEHCSIAMVAIVDQDDQNNYKRNISKIQNKLNMPVKKRFQVDSSKVKKGLIVAASISMLAFTAFAFYSVVNKNSLVENPAKGIPVKPVKDRPAADENKYKVETGTSSEKKISAAKEELGKISEDKTGKKDNQAALPAKVEEKKDDKPAVTAPATALNKEEKEKSVNEVSNSVLVARRKEQPAENIAETKPAQESAPGAEAKIMDANPTGGYGAFNQYLAGNLQYPAAATENKVEGQVPIEFMVEEDGSLSNFAIKKPLGFGCDKEAIRLIKEGPKWNPATENGKAISKKVAVTVNFKLEE